MRPDLRVLVLVLALLSEPPKPEPPKPASPPAPAPDPISEALCGRKSSKEIARAEALDKFSFNAVPESWAKLKRDEFDAWPVAMQCAGAKEDERALFVRRKRVVLDIRKNLGRGLQIDRFEKAVLAFPAWKPVNDDWPAPGDCESCDVLRKAATIAANHVAKWPKRKRLDVIGSWLDGEEKREELIGHLCRARPSPTTRAEMEKQYRYYTWTPSGSKLLDVAKWFEGEDVFEECHQR